MQQADNRGLKELVGDSLIARIKEETQQEPSSGHYFYEVVRDISSKYSEEDKKQAMLDSYDYYRHFWEGYQLGMEFYSESSF